MSNIIGVGQLALLDLNDAIIAGTPPTNPIIGSLWIDESETPPMLKKWNGLTWVDLGELDPNLSVIIEDINETLGNMANDNLINFQERQVIKDKITEIIGYVIADTTTTLPTVATLDGGDKGGFWSVRKSARNVGIETSHATYTNVATRYNNLKSYLEALTPVDAWDVRDVNADKVITVVKSTFRDRWLQYYLAVDALAELTAQKIKDNNDAIQEDVDKIGDDLGKAVGRITTVESKVTDTAIVNTVTSSEKWVEQINVINKDIQGTKDYVKSRGENLVTNGTGLLGDNTNFSQWTFDGAQTFAGGGSFKTTTQNGTRQNDELIPVDPSRKYKFSLMAKSLTGLGHNYFGTVSFDIDGLSISPYHFYGSQYPITTLARDLKVGDTSIYLTSSNGFMDDSTTPDHRHSIVLWGYKNSFGYEYPEGTYSRHTFNTAWAKGGINRTSHVITLSKPFDITNPNDPNGVFKAGHKVSPTSSGGSYQYNTGSNVKVSNTEWQKFEGAITGNGIGNSLFPYGTAYIKLLFLTNRNSSGGTAGDNLWINSLEFTDITTIDSVRQTADEAVDRVDNMSGRIKVRYIRDWLNGSSANTANHWIEIQAIVGSANVALNKKVSTSKGTTTLVTDGVTSGSYYQGTSGILDWVMVDLGEIRDDIDTVNVWHYFSDGRTYNNTKTEVSEDGVNWTTIFDSAVEGTYQETIDGKEHRVNKDIAKDLRGVSDNILLLGSQISSVEQSLTPEGISTVISDSVFYENYLNDMDRKADAEAIGDLATRDEISELAEDIASDIDDAIQGINFEPYATKLELEETSRAITAKFSATGGMNLVKNSIGFAGLDFWTHVYTNQDTTTISNLELDTLGFGSAFDFPVSANKGVYQDVPVVAGQPYTLSWYLNKRTSGDNTHRFYIQIQEDGVTKYSHLDNSSTTTNGYEFDFVTYTPSTATIRIRFISYANCEANLTGIMLNIGDIPLQWSLSTGEVYNTNIKMDINGIRVSQLNEDRIEIGYTTITPEEFAGYYDSDGNGNFEKVFYLNGEETVTKKIRAEEEFTMGDVKIIKINSSLNSGWAFVPIVDSRDNVGGDDDDGSEDNSEGSDGEADGTD